MSNDQTKTDEMRRLEAEALRDALKLALVALVLSAAARPSQPARKARSKYEWEDYLCGFPIIDRLIGRR